MTEFQEQLLIQIRDSLLRMIVLAEEAKKFSADLAQEFKDEQRDCP